MGSKSASSANTETLLRVMADNAKPDKLPNGLTVDDVKRMYEGMVMIRAYDERQKNLQRSGRIGFCVTSTGEEAVQVGTAHALQPNDWVYPYYRQYGVMMYRGVPMDILADHLYGNEEDLAKGRQMPAHYTHKDTHFVSFSSVIGTHLIHAVGTAMAAKYRKDPSVVVTYIGDGGTSSNDFHSSLTFAGVYKPPMVLFIVNNQYAISLPVSKQCGAETLHAKGAGYGVPAVRVDGNDMIAVYQASREAYARARAGEGPTLIELFTYRAGPHSSSDDPTRYRGNEDEQWLGEEKDPIARAKHYMQQLGIWSEAYEEQVWDEARTRINLATTAAEKRPEPSWASMFDDVYAEIPPALAHQRDEFLEKEKGFERQHEGEFPL
jgi:TPP-dependent pyruvate/acetoin dehydrogenase alpha subunit